MILIGLMNRLILIIMQVNCLHPSIIVNPLAAELISQFGNYTIKGHEVNISRRSILYDFKISSINPKKFKVKREDFDSCFITDRSTGQLYSLYLEVPCGHCEVCKSAKVNSFVHRCKLETMQYDCLPIFLTLTYNEENKPETGVNLRDVQLFFKRFRINLYRKGVRQRIRYVLVSEYGKNTKRPHYHAILWNLRPTPFLSYREILQELEKSWSNGYVLSRFVDPSNDKCFFYTAKYLCKDMEIPSGCEKPFMVCSNRGGGIGASFIDSLRESVCQGCNIHPKFCNKFTGRTEDVQLNRYVLNRLFPSFSRGLRAKLKSDLRNYLLSYRILKDVYHCDFVMQYEKETEKIVDFFRPFVYCPLLEAREILPRLVDSPAVHARTLVFAHENIKRAISLGLDYYYNLRFLSDYRELFLSKLFMYEQPEVDLRHKADKFRRSVALAKQREIL